MFSRLITFKKMSLINKIIVQVLLTATNSKQKLLYQKVLIFLNTEKYYRYMIAIEKQSFQVWNTQNDFTDVFGLNLPSPEIQMCLEKEYYPSVFSCAGVVIYSCFKVIKSYIYKLIPHNLKTKRPKKNNNYSGLEKKKLPKENLADLHK